MYPRIRGKNFVTKYGLKELSCVIPNKAAYMDDETQANVVKVVAPGIRKFYESNAYCVIPILLSVYITHHIYTYKFSADDL